MTATATSVARPSIFSSFCARPSGTSAIFFSPGRLRLIRPATRAGSPDSAPSRSGDSSEASPPAASPTACATSWVSTMPSRLPGSKKRLPGPRVLPRRGVTRGSAAGSTAMAAMKSVSSPALIMPAKLMRAAAAVTPGIGEVVMAGMTSATGKSSVSGVASTLAM